jgi:hypothetical protein
MRSFNYRFEQSEQHLFMGKRKMDIIVDNYLGAATALPQRQPETNPEALKPLSTTLRLTDSRKNPPEEKTTVLSRRSQKAVLPWQPTSFRYRNRTRFPFYHRDT